MKKTTDRSIYLFDGWKTHLVGWRNQEVKIYDGVGVLKTQGKIASETIVSPIENPKYEGK